MNYIDQFFTECFKRGLKVRPYFNFSPLNAFPSCFVELSHIKYDVRTLDLYPLQSQKSKHIFRIFVYNCWASSPRLVAGNQRGIMK